MPCYSIEDLVPAIDPSAFVHPTAVVIGDVIIGAGCYVGPNASLRGDFGRVVMHAGSNIQDCCVVHSFPGRDTVVEQDGHIGHGAILHGCRIGRNALVGMNAVLMDDVVIGDESIVAANAFVKARFECPPRSLLVGSPAKLLRELSEEEVGWKSEGTRQYHDLAVRSLESLREVEPLPAPQADRPRFDDSIYKPKGD